MGLDMYLTRKIKLPIDDTLSLADTLRNIQPTLNILQDDQTTIKQQVTNSSLTIISPVIYWRKVSAIHKWFCDNSRTEINDDRGDPVSVSLDELHRLYYDVGLASVLTPEGLASDYNPLRSIQFGELDFTNANVCANYLIMINTTKKKLTEEFEKVTRLPDDAQVSYDYRASW